MKLRDIYQKQKLAISFEVFPPKTDEGVNNLIIELKQLKQFNPAFISVTYGAGGSTQGRSLQVIERIIKDLQLPVMPHFTCVGSNKESILEFIKVLENLKVESILALRGDLPKDFSPALAQQQAFQYANELVAFLKQNSKMSIDVAGYPEKHQEADSLDADLAHLKLKVEAGGEAITTQLFFDNQKFFAYVEKVHALGISVPIIPGIMPLTNLDRIERIVQLSGASIPQELHQQQLKVKDSPEKVKELGINFAVNQIKELIAYGVPRVHLYTLNKSEDSVKILTALGH